MAKRRKKPSTPRKATGSAEPEVVQGKWNSGPAFYPGVARIPETSRMPGCMKDDLSQCQRSDHDGHAIVAAHTGSQYPGCDRQRCSRARNNCPALPQG